MHSNAWKSGSKTGIFLSGITIMKSMVGVGILGLVGGHWAGNTYFSLALRRISVCSLPSSSWCSASLARCSRRTCFWRARTSAGTATTPLSASTSSRNAGSSSSSTSASSSRTLASASASSCWTIYNRLKSSIFGTTCENITNVFKDKNVPPPFYLDRRLLTCLLGLLIYPLMVVKSIEKLRFVSLTAILSIASFTLMLLYNFIISDSQNEGKASNCSNAKGSDCFLATSIFETLLAHFQPSSWLLIGSLISSQSIKAWSNQGKAEKKWLKKKWQEYDEG